MGKNKYYTPKLEEFVEGFEYQEKETWGWDIWENNKLKIGKANSNLTDIQVKEIKNLLKEKKLTGRKIALIYNVHPVTISQINKNKIYERIN